MHPTNDNEARVMVRHALWKYYKGIMSKGARNELRGVIWSAGLEGYFLSPKGFDESKGAWSTWVYSNVRWQVRAALTAWNRSKEKTPTTSIDLEALPHADAPEFRQMNPGARVSALLTLYFGTHLMIQQKTKEALRFYFIEGSTQRDTAKELGCTAQNVQNAVQKFVRWCRHPDRIDIVKRGLEEDVY